MKKNKKIKKDKRGKSFILKKNICERGNKICFKRKSNKKKVRKKETSIGGSNHEERQKKDR